MWRRTGRQRAVAGERRRGRPYRRRRAHSHRPGLCSDKWGASCPDVWSRGPRASPRQRGSCPGPRRSDGGPGPTKPVQPLSTPRRGASSLACTYPPPPRNPPLQGRRASDPREGGNPPGGAASLPHMAVAPATPARKGGPMPADGRRHRPAGGHPACPHREQPPSRLSAEDTPWANRPSKGPRPQSIKGGSSNSLGKGALARKQLLFYPPASFKRRQKNTKQSYTGGLIIRHVCSPRPPSSSTPRPRNPPPLGRRASDRQRPPAT